MPTGAKEERRKPIVCPYCHAEMVCMNRFQSISSLSKGFYAWYVCPRRKKESGCGYTSLVQVFPDKKQFKKTIFSLKLKKLTPKKG